MYKQSDKQGNKSFYLIRFANIKFSKKGVRIKIPYNSSRRLQHLFKGTKAGARNNMKSVNYYIKSAQSRTS